MGGGGAARAGSVGRRGAVRTGPAPRVLFLHGGPGMTAELERRRFERGLPVHWWDQPAVPAGAVRPLDMLLDAASAEISRLHDRCHRRIGLLASAFGAYLARALLERVPDLIGPITICSGLWELSSAILRLGSRFALRSGDSDLENACRLAAETDTPQAYFALFARVSALPGFLECCWRFPAGELREAVKALAAEGRLINWSTCQAVMTAALAAPQAPAPVRQQQPTRIILGRFDPHFDYGDIVVCRRLWPGASVRVVEAGPLPHLELPPPVWMPDVSGTS